jgi:hypothetical protein
LGGGGCDGGGGSPADGGSNFDVGCEGASPVPSDSNGTNCDSPLPSGRNDQNSPFGAIDIDDAGDDEDALADQAEDGAIGHVERKVDELSKLCVDAADRVFGLSADDDKVKLLRDFCNENPQVVLELLSLCEGKNKAQSDQFDDIVSKATKNDPSVGAVIKAIGNLSTKKRAKQSIKCALDAGRSLFGVDSTLKPGELAAKFSTTTIDAMPEKEKEEFKSKMFKNYREERKLAEDFFLAVSNGNTRNMAVIKNKIVEARRKRFIAFLQLFTGALSTTEFPRNQRKRKRKAQEHDAAEALGANNNHVMHVEGHPELEDEQDADAAKNRCLTDEQVDDIFDEGDGDNVEQGGEDLGDFDADADDHDNDDDDDDDDDDEDNDNAAVPFYVHEVVAVFHTDELPQPNKRQLRKLDQVLEREVQRRLKDIMEDATRTVDGNLE